MPTTWPGDHAEADIVQHFRRVDAVAEGDMFEGDLAADRRQCGTPRTEARLRHGVEDVAQPSDRQAGLMEVLPHLRQAQHRHADASGQHVEGDEFADRQVAVDDQLGAEIEDGGDHHLVDHLHGLACRVVQADDTEARRHIAGELLFPAALHLRLDRHGLERLDAGDALDQKGLVLGAAAEFLVEPPAKQRRRASRDRDIEGKGAEHDQGQERRVIEHHRQEDEGEEQIDDERQRRAGQELADVFELAHPRHRIADASRLEIGDRQRQQMPKQSRAELDVDAVCRMREQIGAQARRGSPRTARS